MDSCDVLIAGGGPAGSSCAWALRHSGLKIAILDKQTFPRNKVCGGWITPGVLEDLDIEPATYAAGRVLQPITGFRTGCMGGRLVETNYGKIVSYGVRRYEFDDYLLKRCGAQLLEGVSLERLERSGRHWIVNGRIRTPMLVGAGGTFCPVARFLGAKVSREIVVAAQESEFELDGECPVRGETPELYFSSDMKGYGWCFRKNGILNVGLGRLDPKSLSTHVADFVRLLKAAGRLSLDRPTLLGHAYLLYGSTTRDIAGDGVVLIGDAAGVAYAQSGEGIRPAIESGLLAAKAIVAAHGCYNRERLGLYRTMLTSRFGGSDSHWAARIGSRLPAGVVSSLGKRLMASAWFTREVVLDRWFLRQAS